MEMATLSMRHGGDDDAADRGVTMDDGWPDENRTTTAAAAGLLGPAESSEASGGSGRRGKAKRDDDDDGGGYHDGKSKSSTLPPPTKCAAIGGSRSPSTSVPTPHAASSGTSGGGGGGADRGGAGRERPLLAVATSPPAARGATRRRGGANDDVCDDEGGREVERDDPPSPSPPALDVVAAQTEAVAVIRAFAARLQEEEEGQRRRRLGRSEGTVLASAAAADSVAVENAIEGYSDPASCSGSTSASTTAAARTRRRPESDIESPIRGAGSSSGDVGTETTSNASVGDDDEEQQPAKRRRGGSGDGARKEESPKTIEVPEEYNGRRVAKCYDDVVYFGTVTDYLDAEAGCKCYWHIEYDDGDEEDFDLSDLMEGLRLYAKKKDEDPHELSTSDESEAGEASESSIGRDENADDGGRDVGWGDSSVEDQEGVGADPAGEEDESAEFGGDDEAHGADDGRTPPPILQCCAICCEEDRNDSEVGSSGGCDLIALPCCGGGSDYHDRYSERRLPTPDRELASSTRFCRVCISRHAHENGVGSVRSSQGGTLAGTRVVKCPRCRGLLHVTYVRRPRRWGPPPRETVELQTLSNANFDQSATYAIRRSDGSLMRAIRLTSRVYPHFVPLELFVATARGNRVRGRDDAEALVRWGILDRRGGDDAVYRIDPDRQKLLRERWDDYYHMKHIHGLFGPDLYYDTDDSNDNDEDDEDEQDSEHRIDRRPTSNSTRLFRLLLREAARATDGGDGTDDDDENDGGHVGGGPPSDFVLAGDVFAAGLEAFAACKFVTALRLFNQTCTIHLRSDNFFSPVESTLGGVMTNTSTEFRREWHGWLVSALNVVLLLLIGHLLVVTVLHLMLYYSIVRAVGWAVSTSSMTQRRPGRVEVSRDALRAFVRRVLMSATVVVGGGRLWHLVTMLPHVPNAFHLWR